MRVAAFHRLAPFVFTTRDACMLHSLALKRFLSLYDIRTHWVFGVSTTPFVAHCWLQHDSLVLNDEPEHVTKFTTIMSV
jgi:hypothetical protein